MFYLIQNKKVKIKKIALTIAIVISIIALTYVDSEAKLKEIKKPPNLTARSAAIYCNTTDENVAEKNGDMRVNPYSITKLMTALVILENHNDLNDKVIISKEASEQEGSSMELIEGEEVSVEELLYGLLILSGNDAAYALAEYDSSISNFSNKMNEKAKDLGCTNTHFSNPSGLKEDDHYTTANDFIKIANAALDNKRIEKITGTRKYLMRKTNKQEERAFKTHLDQLKDKKAGVISGKTGYWEDDDCSVALRFNKNNMILTVVLIGDQKSERINDANNAFKFSESKVESVKVLKKDRPAKNVWIRNGKKTYIKAFACDDSTVYPKDGSISSTRIKIVMNKNAKAPLQKGDVVGKAKIYSDGKYMESVPIYVNENIASGWIMSGIYVSNVATICMVLILLIIISVIVIYKSARRGHHS